MQITVRPTEVYCRQFHQLFEFSSLSPELAFYNPTIVRAVNLNREDLKRPVVLSLLCCVVSTFHELLTSGSYEPHTIGYFLLSTGHDDKSIKVLLNLFYYVSLFTSYLALV